MYKLCGGGGGGSGRGGGRGRGRSNDRSIKMTMMTMMTMMVMMMDSVYTPNPIYGNLEGFFYGPDELPISKIKSLT
ncbi:hypothetical protein EYC84_003693 [Monilinia fructicola]|uniref:Uncharacterized protein n=1 Tax=Monilinia fructicola TaxID=38448 RepID=A0A5M9JUI1_MONFR|nr:hypothetical protein EYC84_003693 [Monilinia fructicola]